MGRMGNDVLLTRRGHFQLSHFDLYCIIASSLHRHVLLGATIQGPNQDWLLTFSFFRRPVQQRSLCPTRKPGVASADLLAHAEKAKGGKLRPLWVIRWSDEALNQDRSSSCDRCAMHQTPGVGCDISKRRLRVEPFQVRNWDDESSEFGFRRLTVRMSASTKALSKSAPPKTRTRVFYRLGGNMLALRVNHIRELFPAHLVSCPNDTTSPMVVITGYAVQVSLILQKFITITGRMWSSMLVTTNGFVRLGMMRWRRFL